MIDHRWELWLVTWGAAAALLGALYLIQLRTRDATAVDAGWGTAVAMAAVLAAILGPGDLSHRVLVATIGGVENLRVALLVVRRIGVEEDSRYRELRRRWREWGREQRTFAIFYQAQALLAALLGIPFVLAAFDRGPGLRPVEWAGAALWVAAVAFELVADEQLRRFKADPANRGHTLRTGLWRYSRHPNYFFQTLTWVAYALVALAAPWGWLGFVAPLLVLYFILFVTGIPASEAEAVRHRGDDYRAYQRETSAFVPWFPRRTMAQQEVGRGTGGGPTP